MPSRRFAAPPRCTSRQGHGAAKRTAYPRRRGGFALARVAKPWTRPFEGWPASRWLPLGAMLGPLFCAAALSARRRGARLGRARPNGARAHARASLLGFATGGPARPAGAAGATCWFGAAGCAPTWYCKANVEMSALCMSALVMYVLWCMYECSMYVLWCMSAPCMDAQL